MVLARDQSKQFVEVIERAELVRLTKLYEKFTISDKNLEELRIPVIVGGDSGSNVGSDSG
jgi:hypothetical protein